LPGKGKEGRTMANDLPDFPHDMHKVQRRFESVG